MFMCTKKARLSLMTGQILLAFGLIGAGSSARAQITLDFNNLSNPNSASGYNDQSVVNYRGFSLADTGLTFGGLHSVSPNGAGGYNYTGSVALFNGNGNGAETLTQDNANPFRVQSIDIANLVTQAASPGGVTVTFTGTVAGGGTVTQTFTHAANDSLTTVTFGSAFADLTSFTINQTAPYNQFDNIVVGAAVTTTPEPGSVALLVGMGMTGAGFLVRRRRNIRKVA